MTNYLIFQASSLDNVGNTDQALGDWEQARAAFNEGLEIARRLAEALPNHADYQDLPAWFGARLAGLEKARPQPALGVGGKGRPTDTENR